MQMIGGVPRDEILLAAEEVVKRFLGLPGNKNPERRGGYLTILDKGERQKVYLINEIGECPPSIDGFEYSQEKAERLRDLNYMKGHISAWQSRDRGRNKYGGAVVAPDNSQGLKEGRNIVGAFSGINEHSEEAILLVIWMIFRWITLDDAREICAISDNQLLDPLIQACGDLFDREY